MIVVLSLFLLAGHITHAVAARQSRRLSFSVLEGQPDNTFVGDLRRDAGEYPQQSDGASSSSTFSVRRRQRPTHLPFNVDRRSGVIRTVCAIHRDFSDICTCLNSFSF